MSKLKINFISTWKIRCGIATYAEFLVTKLKKLAKINIIALPSMPPKNPFYWMTLAVKSHKNCDIVHIEFNYALFGINGFWMACNIYIFFYTLNFLNFFSKKKIVLSVHEILPENLRKVRSTNKIFQKLDCVLVHSQKAYRILQKRGYKNLSIIPHGINQNVQTIPSNVAKHRLSLDNKKVITMFGYINDFKNNELAIKIIDILPGNFHLLLAGGVRIDEDKPYFEKISRLASVSKKVTITGFLDEDKKISALSASDYFLFPYKSSTQSGALAEVIAYKKPCLCANLSAFSDISDQYKCLVIVPNYDHRDWAKAIMDISQDKNYSKTITTNINNFLKLTNWDITAKKHLKLYEQVISQN